MNDSKRLFLAFELPDPVVAGIVKIQDGYRSKFPQFKWVKQENLHVTLHFLGDVPSKETNCLIAKLEPLLLNQKALDVCLGSLGVFPHWLKPRVLWLSLQGKDRLLVEELQRKTGELFRKMGYQLEQRSYMPHLTLARIQDGVNNVNQFMKIKEEPIHHQSSFYITKLCLYASILTPQGPIYKPIHRFSFC